MIDRTQSAQRLLILGLAVVWVGTGLVSLLLSPAQMQGLLSGLHADPATARSITWAGAVCDIVLGAALWSKRLRHHALIAQGLVMAIYTLLATWLLPNLWLDPFGPLLKNVAVMAAVIAVLMLEKDV